MTGMADSHPTASGNADTALVATMRTMNQAMDGAPMTGDPDRDFVAMMIPHQQGATDMRRVGPKTGKDPVLLALCRQIGSALAQEIALMRHWQRPLPH